LSILLTMLSVSVEGYDTLLAEGAAPSVAAQAIEGGLVLPLGPGDYGGIRIFSPAEVGQIAQALQGIDATEFSRRFYGRDFTKVYAGIENKSPDELDYYSEAFEVMRDFYGAAAANGLAMLLYLH
jgi:hypothetical protein